MDAEPKANADCAEAWAERDAHRHQIVAAQAALLARVAAGIEPATSLPVGGCSRPEVGQPPPPALDLVNTPPHYRVGGIETIDFIEAKGLDYCSGQVVKYVTRHMHKGDALTDLRKAEWYLRRRIAQLEAEL